MALQMSIQTTYAGSPTAVNLTTSRLHSFKLKHSYDHPNTLTFKAVADQQTYPLGIRNIVRVWDSTLYNPDGTAQSESRPMFIGYIKDVQPESSNSVAMTCYDPTEELSANVNVMSKAWVSSTEPVSDAEPRLVFNGRTIAADDDAFWERESFATVGRIIRVILDDCQPPASLVLASASPPYVMSELDQLNYEPQEKIVFEAQPIRKAIVDTISGSHGIRTRRFFWNPADRQWRFPDITASPAVTLTLGDKNGPVLSCDVRRSLEGRYTAVRIYGPPISILTEAKISDGSLLDVSDSGDFVQSNPPTCCNVPVINRLQIADPTKRYCTSGLPYQVVAQFNDYNVGVMEYPFLVGYYPNDTNAGYKGWRVIFDWYWENKSLGIIRLPSNTSAHRYNPSPTSGQPHYEAPTDIKFVYGLPSAPLQVRSPTTGYGGTAFTVANIANEQLRREELLAAYWDRGTVLTTPSRLAKWQILADYEQSLRRDIVYTGSVVLDGVVTGFGWLNRRVNFAAVDENGAALTTGWESINAVVTEVEYDFEEQTTTLTFSSDAAELIGMDIEEVKQRLKIAAADVRQTDAFVFTQTNIRGQRIGEAKRSQFSQLNNVWESTFRIVGGDRYFVNSVTGEVES